MHVLCKIVCIANAMIGESALPDLSLSKGESKGARIAASNQLNRPFERNIVSGRNQKMNMLGHDDKGVQAVGPVAFV
jgi:hypothetical protein